MKQAHHARALCHLRRSAVATGQRDLTHAVRCARLVCQGILTRSEAEDALALVLAGSAGAKSDRMHVWLHIARQHIGAEIGRLEIERHHTRQAILDACNLGIAVREPSYRLMARAEAVNDEAGRPFVWPELRVMVNEAIGRFMHAQSITGRQRRAG